MAKACLLCVKPRPAAPGAKAPAKQTRPIKSIVRQLLGRRLPIADEWAVTIRPPWRGFRWTDLGVTWA